MFRWLVVGASPVVVAVAAVLGTAHGHHDFDAYLNGVVAAVLVVLGVVACLVVMTPTRTDWAIVGTYLAGIALLFFRSQWRPDSFAPPPDRCGPHRQLGGGDRVRLLLRPRREVPD